MSDVKPKDPRGRKPREPTPEETAEIVRQITATGLDYEACIMAGVPESTFYHWLQLGRAAQKEGIRTVYSDFLEAVKRARATRTTALVASIRLAGKNEKHWQANAWLLERTDPKRFSPQHRVHVTEEFNGAIQRLREAFRNDPESYERAVSALAGGHSAAGAEQAEGGEGGEDDLGGEAVPATPPKPEAVRVPESDV